jgi:hypothetical protein
MNYIISLMFKGFNADLRRILTNIELFATNLYQLKFTSNYF